MSLSIDQNKREPMVTAQIQQEIPEIDQSMITFEQLANKSIKITEFVGQITYLGYQTQIMIKTESTTKKYIKGYLNLSELMSNFELDKHTEQVENGQILIITGNDIESGIYFHPSIIAAILMRYNSKTSSLMNQTINKLVQTENTKNLDTYDSFMQQINSLPPNNQIRYMDARVKKLTEIRDQTTNISIKAWFQDQEQRLIDNKQEQLDIMLQERLQQSNSKYQFSQAYLQQLLDTAKQHEQTRQAPKQFTQFKKSSNIITDLEKEELDEIISQLPVIEVKQKFDCYCLTGLEDKIAAQPTKSFFIYNKECLPFTVRDVIYHLNQQNIKVSKDCNHQFFEDFTKMTDGSLTIYFGS